MPFTLVTLTSSDLDRDPAGAIGTAIEMLLPTYTSIEHQDRFVVLPSLSVPRVESPHNTSRRLVEASVDALQRRGGMVSVGGNPPKALPGPQMVALFAKAGITDIADNLGATQLLDQRTAVVPLRSGRSAKFFALAQYLVGDVFTVLVPRLRPDDLLMFGAVRGSTSGVPGFKREEVRLQPTEVVQYAEKLVDLTEAIEPRLVILQTDVNDHEVLLGTNAYAVDMAAATLLGIDPKSVATVLAAAKRGLGPALPSEVDLLALDR